MLLADFDALPDVQIGGRGAPLVSSTRGGQNVDFDTFLIAAGEADIFFPTDFDALCALYSSVRVEGYHSLPVRYGNQAYHVRIAATDPRAWRERSSWGPTFLHAF